MSGAAELPLWDRIGPGTELARAVTVEAERIGVSPERVLLSSGAISQEAFYRAFAQSHGLPYSVGTQNLHRGARYPDCLLTGIVPLADGGGSLRFLAAPSGQALTHLSNLIRAGGDASGLAITSPARLRSLVEGHFAADIRQAAAYGLSEDHPHASAREGLTFRQRAGLAASVLTSLLAAWAWPAATLAILAALFGVLFLTSLVLRLATLREIFTEKTVQPRRRIADRDLPIYSILAPLFRETRVLPQFVAALKGLDYPPAKLDIKIILEEDDAPMRDAVAALGLPANFEIVIAPRGWPQTKPRALNVALSTARGEFLVIYDAEDRPDPGQLRAALAAFATGGAELACLQGRLVIDNADDTWLTRLFAIDYAALFGILVPGLARMDLPIMLGGTTNHFRTAVLRRVGGWDAFNVTEDADLGFRLARQGFRVGALESETLEEAPVALRAWMRQRTRWMKGWLQTTFVHARRPRQALHSMGAIGYGACLALCCGTVAASLLGPIFLAFACYDIAFGEVTRPAGWVSLIVSSLTLTLFFSGLLITAAQLIAGMRRQGLTQFWPWLFVYPAYLALVSLASWRALFEFITAPHYWHKTEHGLARTSRRKANDGIGGLEFNAAGPPHDLGTPKRI